MKFEGVVLICEQLSYRDRFRLAQQLIQSARTDEAAVNPQSWEESNDGQDEKILADFNLTEAFEAHNKWKSKLERELLGKSILPIDATLIAEDSACKLGQWLQGSGQELYAHLPEFEIIKKIHSDYHMCAADIVMEHRREGSSSSEMDELRQKFQRLSNKNKIGLSNLFTAAKK